MSNTTQKQRLETLLRGTNRCITVSEAREQYGIKNLRARICEMSADGLKIRRKQVGRAFAYGISARDSKGKRTRLYAPQDSKNKQKN